jgi:hypothetical protein
VRIFLYFMFVFSVPCCVSIKRNLVNLCSTTIHQTRNSCCICSIIVSNIAEKCLPPFLLKTLLVLGCIYTNLRRPYECCVYKEDEMKTKLYNLKNSHNPVMKRQMRILVPINCKSRLLLYWSSFTACVHSVKLWFEECQFLRYIRMY